MKKRNFYKKVIKIIEKNKNSLKDDLEKYLRCLLRVVLENQNKELTNALFFKIIDDAFRCEPIEFKEEWFKYKRTPNEDNLSDFEYSKQVILFHIVDRRRVDNVKLIDRFLYDKIISPTNHEWSNTVIEMYLQGGAAGMEDNEYTDTYLSWRFLGRFLELCRMYE